MQLSQAAQEAFEYVLSCGGEYADALARARRVMEAERILAECGFRKPIFCEDECGGASGGGPFDGLTITSDADPGL